MEKAFDRVDWDVLERILQFMGFHPKWIEWINICVHNPKFSVYINGRPRGRIFASRGIRQSDPLSPFFLIISEVLNILISQIHENGHLEDSQQGRIKFTSLYYNLQMTHCCFVNMTMLLDILVQTVGLFEQCTGQKVNWEKSAIYGVNIEEYILSSTAARLNCKAGTFPFTYMGLPLGGQPKRHSFWQPIIDKVHLKLDRWKYSLSRGGRLTLCNAVLANLPTYYMSIFQMPKSVIAELERVMHNFFWEGQKGSKLNHLVSWTTGRRSWCRQSGK